MNAQYEVMTKEAVKAKLQEFNNIERELFQLISQVREGSVEEQQVAIELLKQKYSLIKEEIKEHYKLLSKASTKKNSVVNAFFWPAIQDIHVHISGIGVNSISRKDLSDISSAVYDIGSYANYWLTQLE